jgi:hypothetical protein
MLRIILTLSLVVLSAPIPAYSFGERFKVETTGTEYCADFDVIKRNPGNNVDLWVEVVNQTVLTVSTTADFQVGTTFPMIGLTYQIKATSGAFIASDDFSNGGYVTAQGIVKVNGRTGDIMSLSRTFIQNNMFDDNCFSSGKFKTVQRIL